MRKIPHPDDDAQLAGELVRGYCAFDGAPEDVWTGMGNDREEVEETRSSALEVSISLTHVPVLTVARNRDHVQALLVYANYPTSHP